MIVDENKPTPLNTPSKQDGAAVRPDVQAAVQKSLQARSGHPPKMVTNNFAAIWALEKERRRTSLRLKRAIEASAKTVVPPEQYGDEAWFLTNVANTFLEFVTNSLMSQPLPPRAPAEVIYSTPQPTSPAPQRPQAQASTAAHAIEEQQTYGDQYLNGIVPPPSLPPTGNPVNPDAIYESSSSSSSLGFGMMTSSLSGGSSRQDSSLASLGSYFSLGHDVPLGNTAAISAPASGLTEAARTPPRSSKLRAEAPIFVPGTGLVLAD